MPIGQTFPQVLEAARAGAEWAWRAIYSDLSPSVMGYFRARGVADAEDLTAEVFLDAVRNLRGFEGGERDLRAWVLTIAHRRLVDHRRRSARRPVDPSPDDLLEAEAPSGDVEDEGLTMVAAGRVREAIEALSDDQRSVLLLRLFGQMTVPEVAAALGRSEEAVKALQRRGLTALRKQIARLGVPL